MSKKREYIADPSTWDWVNKIEILPERLMSERSKALLKLLWEEMHRVEALRKKEIEEEKYAEAFDIVGKIIDTIASNRKQKKSILFWSISYVKVTESKMLLK